MINIEIDHILFKVYGDKTLWQPPSAQGVFIDAPAEWAALARALVEAAQYPESSDMTLAQYTVGNIRIVAEVKPNLYLLQCDAYANEV